MSGEKQTCLNVYIQVGAPIRKHKVGRIRHKQCYSPSTQTPLLLIRIDNTGLYRFNMTNKAQKQQPFLIASQNLPFETTVKFVNRRNAIITLNYQAAKLRASALINLLFNFFK